MLWIKCEEELPPCDGTYWTTCDAVPPKYIVGYGIYGDGTRDYDGYGWKSGNGYCDKVTYWMPYRKKKYGKQTL